jgi:hypothetical protein
MNMRFASQKSGLYPRRPAREGFVSGLSTAEPVITTRARLPIMLKAMDTATF